MDKRIIEASELPEQDNVFLKKDFLGWRIVNPIKNEDGSWNWVNLLFGGWRNLINLIILLIVISISVYFYKHDISQIQQACNLSQALQIRLP